ncbi:MAG: histidine kinase, partial [Treponema sp.]|nr:histidine kinase [Treponema sp.]
NTLNTGVQLAMMEGADKTSYFIEQVASFFRYNIQQQKQVATIDEELGLVDNFVYIMKVRFGKRLEFIKDVPDGEFKELVPTMTLQPLVENCIKHGLKNTMGRVELKVTRQDEFVEIKISDNGAGFDEEIRQRILVPIHKDEIVLAEEKKEEKKLSDGEMHNGIGLINVLLRLKLYFHRDDVFDIPRSEPGQGATFIIRVPKNV